MASRLKTELTSGKSNRLKNTRDKPSPRVPIISHYLSNSNYSVKSGVTYAIILRE